MKREKQKCRKSIVVKPSDSISFISTRAIVDCPLLIFLPLAQLEDTRHHICHQFVLVFVIAPICRASAYLMVPAPSPLEFHPGHPLHPLHPVPIIEAENRTILLRLLYRRVECCALIPRVFIPPRIQYAELFYIPPLETFLSSRLSSRRRDSEGKMVREVKHKSLRPEQRRITIYLIRRSSLPCSPPLKLRK